MPAQIRQIDKNNCIALVNAVRDILLGVDTGAEAKRQQTETFRNAAAEFLPGGQSENFGKNE